MSYKENSLTTISVNATLNILLESFDDITLQQLKETSYENRVMFFEDFIYHDIAILLADRYTMLNDYPSIIGELFPFSLKELHDIIKCDMCSNMISTFRSNNVLVLLKFLSQFERNTFCTTKKQLHLEVIKIIIYITLIRWQLESYGSSNEYIIKRSVGIIRKRILSNEFSCLPTFRSKVLNVSHCIELSSKKLI